MSYKTDETKRVKEWLVKGGRKNVSVKHGKGTARAWLHIKVDRTPEDTDTSPMEFCDLYKGIQSLTGRSGSYDGNIIITGNR